MPIVPKLDNCVYSARLASRLRHHLADIKCLVE